MSTTIRILNASGSPLTVTTRVQPALSEQDYRVLDSAVPASDQAVPVVQFDRDEGIHDGKVWTFTTAFELDGVQVVVQERLMGTLLSSDMSQCMSAGAITTGFRDTDTPASITFAGASGALYELGWALSGFGFKDIQYTLMLARPKLARIAPVMPQIDTVVMMMFENRSLDTVLGWLYRDGRPNVVYPPGTPERYDGIPPDAANYHHSTRYQPALGTQGMPQPCRVPNLDPNEGLPNVKNQLYADAFGKLPDAEPWSRTPTMTGFAWDYDEFYSQNQEVMGAYTPEQLPVLSGLARNYAVSDRWFSSAPTQTDPNRAFSICGTSLGGEVNDDLDGSTFAASNTLFNALGEAGKTWGIYWQTDGGWAAGSPFFDVYTPYFFPRIAAAKHGGVHPFASFLSSLREGTLPNFCYLEPKWGGGVGVPGDPLGWVGYQGDDYHPPAWIGPAENDLNTLYDAIVRSPQWQNMLFIVTFDEHGGTWDHVPPPATIAPDERVGKSGFRFDRLGVRVPTLLISPFIPGGMVFRSPDPGTDFDHTSFIATLLKWAGVDPASANLGKRTAVAPTFEGVLSDTRRSDTPVFNVPAGYADQGTSQGVPQSPLPHVVLDATTSPPKPMDIRAFRQACEQSESPDDLRERLRKLT
jgi:phospholipase C